MPPNTTRRKQLLQLLERARERKVESALDNGSSSESDVVLGNDRDSDEEGAPLASVLKWDDEAMQQYKATYRGTTKWSINRKKRRLAHAAKGTLSIRLFLGAEPPRPNDGPTQVEIYHNAIELLH